MESVDFEVQTGVLKDKTLPKGIRGGTYILYGAEVAKVITDRISNLSDCGTEQLNNMIKSSVDQQAALEIAEQIWETGKISYLPNSYNGGHRIVGIVQEAFGEETFIDIFKTYIYYRSVINPKFMTVNRKIKKFEKTTEITSDNVLSFYSIANFNEEQRDFVIKGLVQLITSFQKDIVKMLKYKTYNVHVDLDDIVIYNPRKEDVYMSVLHGKIKNIHGHSLLKDYATL